MTKNVFKKTVPIGRKPDDRVSPFLVMELSWKELTTHAEHNLKTASRVGRLAQSV